MKSLHFIMVYNAASLDNAKELAKRELDRFGLNKLGIADWHHIASVYSEDGHEFNPNIYTEFGVTNIVNSFDGDRNFIVTVYQK